ncbi:Diacetylchitobiose uptake system permease protein NgcG [Paenibacillus auburnensis]|uniref:Diacetylchitobiose uptake system permease protein NgcG n=1 Tax=Paenibacillus auburnensis TaxID=2905649 RepID=A0ABM9C9I0_9BACL|nr:carbohydrate ABC transporter permease [Paenibacillus auburnensis]CAH1207999.1 Diacetylchitobiose uptake system permease protein NgcG [Paenibacillus auburnensis]
MVKLKWNSKTAWLQLFLVMFAIIQFAPLVWLVLTSFKSNIEITGSNVIGFPEKWLLSNYRNVFVGSNLGLNFLNSLLYTGATVLASGLLSAMVSFAITRMQWKLSKVVLAVFMSGLMIPVHATLLPIFQILKQTHLLNTPWALIIPYTVNAIPAAMFIMVGFFSSLPRELEEASVVDGCNIYQVFFKIMLPLIKPAIVSVSIFTFLAAWNELMFATTFISNTKLMTITVAINSLRGLHTTEYGPIAAGMVIATIPTILIYILLSDKVQKSIVAGAVKG